MPGPQPLRKQNYLPTDQDVATTNSTANFLLGGRRPSWVTSGKPVKPSPRVVKHNSTTRKTPSIAPLTDATVLLSPAPSDEPSPAISNTQDSPYMSSANLPEAQPRETSTATTTATMQSRPPVTEARFVVNTAPIANPPLPQNSSNGVPVLGSTQDVGMTEQQPQMSSTYLQTVEQPRKRRRLEHTGHVAQFRSFIPNLESHIRSVGGYGKLSSGVERPRFQLLRDACATEDGFFVALHQLFCVWSLCPDDVYELLHLEPATTDTAMSVIEQVLKKNDELLPQNLKWFSQFPGIIAAMTTHFTNYPNLVIQVGGFLQRLAIHWANLVKASNIRLYPYLVDELVGILACTSPVLQGILFTAARRRLGVLDGSISQAMDTLFRNDQHIHKTTEGSFFARSTNLHDMIQQNRPLIDRYIQMVRQANMIQPVPPQIQPQSHYVPIPSPVASNPQSPGLLNAQMPQFPQFAQNFPQVPAQGQQQPLSTGARRSSYQQGHPTSQHQQSQPLQQFVPVSHGQTRSPSIGQGVTVSAGNSPSIPQTFVLPSQHFQHVQPISRVLSPQTTQLQNVPPQHHQILQPRPGDAAGPTNLPHIPPQYLPNAAVGVTQQINGVPYVMNNSNIRYVNGNGQSVQHPQSAPRPPLPLQQVPSYHHHILGVVRQAKLLPPPGFSVPRSDWPYDTSDRKSVIVGLHQATLRSPKRVMRDIEEMEDDFKPERYYQSIKRLAVGPTPIPAQRYLYEFEFTINETEMTMLSRTEVPEGELLPRCDFFDGALRYRLRCVQRRNKVNDAHLTESDWAMMDAWWPPNIFIKFNGKPLTIRRHMHNGKDLPVELTQMIQLGRNTIQLAAPLPKQPLKDTCIFFGVDVIETASHSAVVDRVWKNGLVNAEVTVDKIKARLKGSSSGDDTVSIQQPELSIDLADPFSAKVFQIPARGSRCTHMECFDLDNWLNTRPTKPLSKCQHRMPCSCQRAKEPSLPDKWKCPICHEDARPGSLQIDGFLLSVRAQLDKEDKLNTKSMLVAVDGTWKPVIEEDDDDDDGSDGEGIGMPATGKSMRKSLSVPAPSAIIELLDD